MSNDTNILTNKIDNSLSDKRVSKGTNPYVYKELPIGWDSISVDTEYIAVTNRPTIPLTIQYASADQAQEFLHPNNPYKTDELRDIKLRLDEIGEKDALKIFKAPFATLDYLKDKFGIVWRIPNNPNKRRYVHTIKQYIFFSFKDIEFQFRDVEDYKHYVLPKLDRIRRITTSYNRPIALPYEIRIPTKKGYVWKAISIELIDISAMQGGKGLKVYMQNVGMSTDDKVKYTSEDKSRMDLRLKEDPKKFLDYIRTDVQLVTIYGKTIDFFNKVADLIGVEPREDWGLSTGKIVANMVSDWIAKKAKLPVTDAINEETKEAIAGFYQYNRLATPEAIKNLSHVTGNKNLLYLGMTDGGRCVKERTHINKMDGALVDIDIAGCYGNGLLNQAFPVGNPKIIFTPMKFRDWEKKFSKKLVPGLWMARVSWENSPFKQDLLISKEDKQFTAWEHSQRLYTEASASDANRQYDATMYLMTNTVKHAALTHDLYQALTKYSANSELAWIRDNAIIESFAFYASNEEVDSIKQTNLFIDSFDKYRKGGIKWLTDWQRVELKELMNILLTRRGIHKKIMGFYKKEFKGKDIPESIENTYDSIDDVPKCFRDLWEVEKTEPRVKDDRVVIKLSKADYNFQSSMQEFIKLIANTIYGCIASAYFGTNGTGISNFVVGNNITARARTLAWCMAKGFHSLMSITDGGVFDVNKVAYYRQKSLNIFANLSQDILTKDSGNKVVDIKPLYDFELPINEDMFKMVDGKSMIHVEVKAWEHLKNIFSDLDIFKKNQFWFEVKSVYTSCEIRNKSDYRLINNIDGAKCIRLRGLKKDESNVEDHIFNDIGEEIAGKHHQVSKRLLGLTEWQEREELRRDLLPHDEITSAKDFYTLTPLGVRFINPEHRKDILRLYDQLKIKDDEVKIAQLAALEKLENWEEYKNKKARSSKKLEN